MKTITLRHSLSVIFPVLIGLVGTTLIVISRAATAPAALEPETSTVTGSAATINDTSASGSSALIFKTSGAHAGGTASNAPMVYPARAVDLYHMMWSNSGSPKLSTTPSNVNVIRLAFAQGDPPRIVGWTAQGEADFVADAKALRARGVRIILSVGGAGGSFNVANRQAVVDGIMAINSKVPLDGLDWDLEGPPINSSDVVWIARELDRLRGANFAQTMVPNGNNVLDYLPVAKALQDAGLLDAYGQQFYDAPVTKEAALHRVNQAIDYGIPENKIQIGMMIADGANWWTVQQSVDNYTWLKSRRPNLKGAYLWEAGRTGTTEWAARVGQLVYQ